MAYRARNILIAVALAAVAALLTSFYVTSYKRHVQRGGTLRALSLEGDQNQLLAGTLKTGDSVDFVAALKKPGDQDIYFSRVLVRDIKVLKAPAGPPVGNRLTTSANSNYTVMLALSDSQAQKLQYLLANAGGAGPDRWHLELRPATHDADSP